MSIKNTTLAVVIAFSALVSLTVSAFAVGASFSDVPSDMWCYEAVTEMANRGLVNGVGDGLFAPDRTMTRAEFLTVIVRAVYPSDIAEPQNDTNGTWWTPYYAVALDRALLREIEFDFGDLDKPCTRQEMSMLLVRAIENGMDETINDSIPLECIPDRNSVGGYYKDYVRKAYSAGLLVGTDSKGTFSPTVSLPRSQAATVLYRMIEPSKRQQLSGRTFHEGEARDWMPQVGDICIAKDGRRVVIERGIGGVLGAGQGVDIWSGYARVPGIVQGYNNGIDSVNDTSALKKGSITGEVHTENEWSAISRATDPNGKVVGDYDGEIYNTWWKWESRLGIWVMRGF